MRAALPIPVCVGSLGGSVCQKKWYGCQCLGFLTCAQMLKRAIAQGGCTDTVRESALEVDIGRKILCRSGDSNRRQNCA